MDTFIFCTLQIHTVLLQKKKKSDQGGIVMGWLPFMDLSQLDRISFWQGPHKLYLRSEDIMKFRQNNPPFPPLPVHSIANYLSFHPSIQPFIHSLALPNNVDSSRACPIVLFLRPGYPGTCIPMYTTMSLKFFGRHFSVD